MNLTPKQLHYFKRELITQQLDKELHLIKKSGQLSSLVIPTSTSEYPILKFFSKHFILDFPLLKRGEGDNTFWSKLQAFLDEYRQTKVNNYIPKNTRDSQRRVLRYTIEQYLIMSLCAIIKTKQGKEEVIDPLHLEENEDDITANFNLKQLEWEDNKDWKGTNGWKINIITVRDVAEVRRVRQHIHNEFIIETVRTNEDSNNTPTFVSRRHGDFIELRDELKEAFPTEEIPSVPAKAHDASYNSKAQHLHREKDRIMLRSFIRRLSAIPSVANSDIFKEFLLDDPVKLTAEEISDAEDRFKMDKTRLEEEKRFKEHVDKKIHELEDLLKMLKKQIMNPNGLLELFQVIKTTETIEQLPSELRKAFEWGRVNLAFVLHTHFVTSDRSIEYAATLRRTHSLMPYRTMSHILKLSNPFAMVKGVLDLFLAQPFGGRSLFQRIILANMSEETKEMQKDIEDLESKIKDSVLCKKIFNAVKTKCPDNESKDTEIDSITETIALLNNPDIEPELSSEKKEKLALAISPDQESSELVQNLYKLWVLHARKQEQELLMTLVFQGVTGDIIKDLFAIFYEPLAQIYKAANFGDTIGHVSGFLDDLLKIIDSLNVQDATNTAKPFIDLVEKHEGEFYQFVHSVYVQDQSKLFDKLLAYFDSALGFISKGLSTPVDLEKVVVEAGITPTEYTALKVEIDAICEHQKECKKRHLERKRQKILSTTASDKEDKLLHELTIEHPKLDLLPKITPVFVEHFKKIVETSEELD